MRGLVFLVALLLAGCHATGPEQRDGYRVDHRYAAPGARPRIKVLVIHYTAEDFSSSLSTLTAQEVSAHYLIPQRPVNNTIWQLVPESELAWHAGPSFWRGATRLNDTSVGIELVNSGYRRTLTGLRWAPFSPEQISTLKALLKDVAQRYHIKPENIVGHSDIAPQRKQDPGPCFPWRQLAQAGLGAWPDARQVRQRLTGREPDQPVEADTLLTLLRRYGYAVTPEMTPRERQNVIAAFQMHFRPADYRGRADAETEAIAQALLDKYGAAF